MQTQRDSISACHVATLSRSSCLVGTGSFGTIYKDGDCAYKVFRLEEHAHAEREANMLLAKMNAPESEFVIGTWIGALRIPFERYAIMSAIKMRHIPTTAFYVCMHAPIHGIRYVQYIMDPIIRGLVTAVAFLNSHAYTHGDLKLDNILISPDRSGFVQAVRLADFSNMSKLATERRQYNMSEFRIYRHHQQFGTQNASFTTCEAHEQWSLATCITDLAKRQHHCKCKCTALMQTCEVEQIIHVATKFKSAEHRELHVNNIMKDASARLCRETPNNQLSSCAQCMAAYHDQVCALMA